MPLKCSMSWPNFFCDDSLGFLDNFVDFSIYYTVAIICILNHNLLLRL